MANVFVQKVISMVVYLEIVFNAIINVSLAMLVMNFPVFPVI